MFVYYLYFVIIFGNFVKVLTSSDESNIDHMPEEEQEDFTRKIAKKNSESIKPAENHKKVSGDIPDKQLEEHDAFVKKIYEEESQNLRRVMGGVVSEEGKGDNKEAKEEKENNDTKDSINVNGYNKNNEREDINFTLRKWNTDSKFEIPTVRTGDNGLTVKEENKSEDTVEKDIQVRNIHREITEKENSENLEPVTNENNVHEMTGIYKFDSESVKENENNLNITNFDSNGKDKSYGKPLTETTDIPEVTIIAESTKTTDIVNVTDVVNIEKFVSDEIETTPRNNLGITEFIYNSYKENENSTNLWEKKFTMEVKSKKISLNITTADNNKITFQKILKNVSNKYENFSNEGDPHKTNLKHDEINTIVNNGEANNTKNKSKIETQKKSNILFMTKSIFKSNLFTPNPIENNNNEDKIDFTPKDTEKDLFARNLVNALKVVLIKNNDNILKVEKIFNKNSISSRINKRRYESIKGKEYHVYEIAPNQSAFLYKKSNQPNNQVHVNKEEPHFVSIYNYSPNNAYYNSKNRYGYNSDENYRDTDVTYVTNDRDEISDRSDGDVDIFEVGGKKFSAESKPLLKASLPINNLDNLVKEASMLRNHNQDATGTNKIYKNIIKIFLHSSEAEYPFTGYKEGDESVKSNIKDARKNLYKQQTFDYIPHINSIESKGRYREIEDLGKENKSLRTDEPMIVKPYKNVGYVLTGNGKKKLYLPFDEINKYDVNTFKFNDRMYKASEIARYGRNLFDETNTKSIVQNKMKDILIFIHPKQMRDAKMINIDNNKISDSNDINVYVELLEDMIKVNNEVLAEYDWLGSTVDIQAALLKLLGLITSLRNSENIHASDLQLLKYILNIFKTTKNDFKALKEELSRSFLPRNKNRVKHTLIKKKGLLDRVWLYRRTLESIEDLYNKLKDERVLYEFEEFLKDLEDNLYHLHEAIKDIAVITKYNKQKWSENLKDLYLKGKREYLEVILHLSTSRLFSLIEESARNGLEDYKEYIKNNEEDYMKTKRELVFVLNILEEIKFEYYF